MALTVDDGGSIMPEISSDAVRGLVAAVAGPQLHSDNRKSWLARAARKAGISFRQIKSLFYGEIRDPNHRSVRLLRDAAESRAAADAQARAEVIKNFRALLALRDSLVASDQAFNQPQINALEHALGLMVGDVGARALRRDEG